MQSELEMSVYNQQDDPKTTTAKIKRSIVQVLQELGIVEKLNIAADDAHKAWETAKRIEQREIRSKNAALAAYKMESPDK